MSVVAIPQNAGAVLKLLEELELLATAHLDELKQGTGKSTDASQEIIQRLVKRGWLTNFQAQRIAEGHAGDLVLGSYRLLSPLGEGGMGEVFKARHQLMNRTVAVKLIRKDWLGDREAVRRFRREIELAGQLKHAHIVVAHDAEQIGERLFLVMEYCEGLDLGRVVRKSGPLPVGSACRFIHQAALGLQHAFERGIIHRDIKPSNLLVTREGVKILDMGLARLRPMEGEAGSETLTQRGAVMGTPDFIAPEQARSVEYADIRSDLYSLGCTLYFALTGQVPYPGGTTVEKILRHQAEQPTAVERLRPNVPVAVAGIVRRLMAQDPAARYQTPAEAAAALLPFATDEEPPEAATRVVVAAEPSTASLTGGAPPLPPTRLSTLSPAALPTTRSNAPADQRDRSRPHGWWIVAAAVAGLLVFGVLLVLIWSRWLPGKQGKALDSSSSEPSSVVSVARHWEKLPSLLGDVHDENILDLAFSPDSTLLAIAFGDWERDQPERPGRVEIWDIASKQKKSTIGELSGPAHRVAFEKDGTVIVIAMGDRSGMTRGTVEMWKWQAHKQVGRFVASEQSVVTMTLHHDGHALATSGYDGSLRLWDLSDTDKPRRELVRTGRRVGSLAFTHDGKTLVGGDEDGSIRCWDVDSGKSFGDRKIRQTTSIAALDTAGDDDMLVAATGVAKESSGPGIYFWQFDKTEPSRSVSLEGERLLCLAMAPDRKTFATGCNGGWIRIWNVGEQGERESFHLSGSVQALAFSPDGRYMAAGGGWDLKASLWQGK